MVDENEARQAYLVLKAKGVGLTEAIRVLRAEFGLSLVEAKRVCVEHDTGQRLDAIQAGLVPAVEQVSAHLKSGDDRI